MLSRLRCTVLSTRLTSCFTARALRHGTAGGAEVPRAHEAQGFGDVARDARQLHRAQGHILTTSPLGVSYKQQLSGLHEGFILLRYHILYIILHCIYALFISIYLECNVFIIPIFYGCLHERWQSHPWISGLWSQSVSQAEPHLWRDQAPQKPQIDLTLLGAGT